MSVNMAMIAGSGAALAISEASVWIIVAAVAAVVAYMVVLFNRLVRSRNLVMEGWSGIDVQLTRRHSLVPNLVETVKGYSRHERQVLEEVASLRTKAHSRGDLKDRQDHENVLTDQIKTLFALAERYPDLKANQSFLDLQKQLAEIEDQIQMARRYYNGAVRGYNIRVESFPSNVAAWMFDFAREEFFEIETATHRQAPKVEMK
jgi:LemA protein